MKPKVNIQGSWERTMKSRFVQRLTLRRSDGRIYLDRWAFILHQRIGGVFLHKMSAPDPGRDLHDHPFPFVSLILWGGYIEERANIRDAPRLAAIADNCGRPDARGNRGVEVEHRPFTLNHMRLDECHSITKLRRRTCWTLVLRGPRVRKWGFYLANGYMEEAEYDRTVRAERRDLWSDQNAAGRPWAA